MEANNDVPIKNQKEIFIKVEQLSKQDLRSAIKYTNSLINRLNTTVLYESERLMHMDVQSMSKELLQQIIFQSYLEYGKIIKMREDITKEIDRIYNNCKLYSDSIVIIQKKRIEKTVENYNNVFKFFVKQIGG